MNVLDGELDADGRSFVFGDQRIELGERLAAECKAAGVTALGLRPEDLEIVPADTLEAVTGEIYVVEPMGNETLVDVRIGDHVYIEERTIDVHIRRLRLNLQAFDCAHMIETVRGGGYRLAAPR